MMINKNRFKVSNDKKLLRKKGKQWVTVSIAMLALLGGSAVVASATHADATPEAKAESTVAVKNELNK